MDEGHVYSRIKIFEQVLIKCLKQKINEMNKRWMFPAVLFFCLAALGQAQGNPSGSLSLDSCYAQARKNFPAIRQFGLIERATAFSLENADKAYLPQINLAGQATYQSDVTQVSVPFPGVEIPVPPKDQYRAYGEISQPITTLFTTKDNRELIEAGAEIERQQVEVELFQLKERINNLFFGILLIDAQIKSANLVRKDIEAGLAKTQTAIDNGVALKSNASSLKAELLSLEQRVITLRANRRAFCEMLGHFLGREVSESVTLVEPVSIPLYATIQRPELRLFDLRSTALHLQKKLIRNRNLPHLSLFFQGGVGRPALNMLSTELQGYYITGLRFNWNISGYYTRSREQKIIEVNQEKVKVQRDVFLFQTELGVNQQRVEIQKMTDLMASDREIIALREEVIDATKNQLEFGTATSNDFLVAVNAKDQARQNLVLHEIQLLMAQYNLQTTTGN